MKKNIHRFHSPKKIYFKKMIQKRKRFMPRNNVYNILKVKQVICLQIEK